MKKLFVTALAAAFVAGASVQALPVGNPSEASSLIDGIFWEGVAGDPCDPCATWCDSVSLRAGFYGDYVFNRLFTTNVPEQITGFPNKFATTGPTTVVTNPNAAYDKDMFDSDLFTNAGYIALNIWDRFDVFTTLGATSAYVRGCSSAFNLVGTYDVVFTPGGTVVGTSIVNNPINNGDVEIYTNADFSWSIGAKGSLWECGCATLGAEFQYAKAYPNVSQVNVNSNLAQFQISNPMGYVAAEMNDAVLPAPATAPSKKAKINYNEWQAGLGFAYRVNSVTPYVAVKWAKANFKMDGLIIPQPAGVAPNPSAPPAPTTAADVNELFQGVCLKLNNLKSKKSCGIAIGATLIDADKVSITAEARLIDERAVHVNGQFRF
ncbi:MAG: hypothetical protein RR796_02295 [Victivallaceae bacterium]